MKAKKTTPSTSAPPPLDPLLIAAAAYGKVGGRIGGKSKSKRKLAAVRQNIQLAIKARWAKPQPQSRKAA